MPASTYITTQKYKISPNYNQSINSGKNDKTSEAIKRPEIIQVIEDKHFSSTSVSTKYGNDTRNVEEIII